MPASHSDDAVRRARAYLLRVAEPPAAALVALIAEHGPVHAATLVRGGTAPGAVLDATSGRRHDDLVDADFAAAAGVGARLVIPEDDEWPTQLAVLGPELGDGARWAAAPVALWVRGTGQLADLLDRAITVVGARSATNYGEHVAAEFGYGLASEGLTVVSGASYGIDAAAHRGTLAADGVTVAVLGCGIDVGYPSGNATLLNRMVDHGLLVSEYPPGTQPDRQRFLHRSRLLAAATAGTVLVEAGVRTGGRTVVAIAAAIGRAVMAVPGPITSVMSNGCHEFLRLGTAIPVASVAEIIESASARYPDLRVTAGNPPTD